MKCVEYLKSVQPRNIYIYIYIFFLLVKFSPSGHLSYHCLHANSLCENVILYVAEFGSMGYTILYIQGEKRLASS